MNRISDAASLRSAPGSLQHTSFERAASPRTTGSLSSVPEGHGTSPSNPLTSPAHEENTSRDARVDNDVTGITMPVTHGAVSPVKAEPDPEGPWFTVGRDGRHTRSASRSSANLMDRGLGGRVPLSEEVRTTVQRAEESLTPSERLAYHERMRRELELQERERVARLRQIEEDAWLAEQLDRTPEYTQRSTSAARSIPALSQNSIPVTEYIETQRDVRSSANDGHNVTEPSRWVPRTSEGYDNTGPSPSIPRLPAPDDRFSALEHQVDVMARAMEKLIAAQYAQHSHLEPVVQVAPPSVTTRDNDPTVPTEAATPIVNIESASKRSKKDKQKAKSKKTKSSLMPSAQLEPSSFLGRLLSLGGGHPGDDSSSSSSSSSAGSGRNHGDEAGSSHNDSDPSSDHRKDRRPRLKPVNLDKYDGRENAEAFHKYVRQMSEYLAGYQVKKSMFASTASNFLTGKAYHFFIHKVAGHEPETWDMNQFFTELFNYCFDHNYQQRMLDRLDGIEQGTKTVQEYVHEFEETVQQVGIISGTDRVNRLFRGFKLGVQGDLYFRGITPLRSSWDMVVEEALLVEAAHRARTGAFRSKRDRPSAVEEKVKSKDGSPGSKNSKDNG